MKSQKLINSILQHAVEGKLIPQNTKDTNINETLKELSNRKKSLGNSIKLPKKYNSGLDETPYEIPHNWKWVRLGELSRKITDGVHKRPKYTNDGVPFLSVKNISSGVLSFEETRFVSIEDHKKMVERCDPEKGDILFCRIGTLGKPVVIETNQEFSIFVSVGLIKLIDNRMSNFIKLVMESPMFMKQINQVKVDGSHTSKINLRDVPNFWIPLPPLEEQQRILNKVEKLSIKIEEYDNLERKLTSLDDTFPIKIEKSILQYAMEGKLTPQITSDEPAKILYKRISDEKNHLIDNKTIRREKASPPLKAEEIPFEIPKSWKWVRLGDIGRWGAGSTPSRSNPLYYSGDIPWLKTGELNDGVIHQSNEHITELALEETSVKLNPIGSVLIAMYGATIGKLGILSFEATTNQACCACIPYKGIYNKFLFYYLMSERNTFINAAEGGAQPNISRSKIINFPFPLPPFKEQQRIVEKIEEILNQVDKLNSF